MRTQPRIMIRAGASLLGLLAICLAAPLGVVAQEDTERVAVLIDPVGPGGVKGFGILATTADGTVVQVSVQDPPPETSAAIHPGACDDLDPVPVALLGTLPDRALVTTTLPTPITTLADGAHALVIHPGLDLETVLGCGAIPAMAPAVGAPTDAPGTALATEHFAGTRYPYAITWTAPWKPVDYEGASGAEGVALSNGTSSVYLEPFDQAGGDALACRDAWERRLLDAQRAQRITGMQPAHDAAGGVIWDGDAERARGGYTWAWTATPETTWAEVVDCRRLSETAVLLISHVVKGDAYLAEVPLVEQLLTGLDLSGATVAQTPEPAATPEPVPTPAPTPEPVPTPTPGPDCTGMQPWVDNAVARLERTRDVGMRARRSESVRELYVQALRAAVPELDQVRAEQRADVPPPSLAKIQAALDEYYATTIDAYLVLADAYQLEDGDLFGEAEVKGKAAESILSQLAKDVREILDPCGIRLPA